MCLSLTITLLTLRHLRLITRPMQRTAKHAEDAELLVSGQLGSAPLPACSVTCAIDRADVIGHKLLNARDDFIANTPEHLQAFGLGSRCTRRIVEAPMKFSRFARKNGASSARSIANGDDIIEPFAHHFNNRLRALSADVDSDFCHHLNGHRMNIGGSCARARDFTAIRRKMS